MTILNNGKTWRVGVLDGSPDMGFSEPQQPIKHTGTWQQEPYNDEAAAYNRAIYLNHAARQRGEA